MKTNGCKLETKVGRIGHLTSELVGFNGLTGRVGETREHHPAPAQFTGTSNVTVVLEHNTEHNEGLPQ